MPKTLFIERHVLESKSDGSTTSILFVPDYDENGVGEADTDYSEYSSAIKVAGPIDFIKAQNIALGIQNVLTSLGIQVNVCEVVDD